MALSGSALRLIEIFDYSAQASILLPVGIGFWRRSLLPRALRIMFYCCIMWAIIMAAAYIAHRLWAYNVAVYDLVDLLEMWFIGWSYYYALKLGKLRRCFLPLGIVYSLFAFLEAFVIHGLYLIISYTITIKSVLIIALSILYFDQCLHDLRNIMLERDPMFLVSVALLLYYAGTVAMFAILNSISTYEEQAVIYTLNSFLNVVMHTLIARALWLGGRKQQTLLPHLFQLQPFPAEKP